MALEDYNSYKGYHGTIKSLGMAQEPPKYSHSPTAMICDGGVGLEHLNRLMFKPIPCLHPVSLKVLSFTRLTCHTLQALFKIIEWLL